MVVGAQSVRYRRELSLGEEYALQTSVCSWDHEAFYIEHRFLTGEEPNAFVHAIIFVKNNLLGSKQPQDVISMLDPTLTRPDIPREFQLWMDSNKVSSENLRRKVV